MKRLQPLKFQGPRQFSRLGSSLNSPPLFITATRSRRLMVLLIRDKEIAGTAQRLY